jgi:transcriptional regulator with XRE-family HTH domain
MPDGPRIREIRKQRGYTPTEFARKIRRHRQTIWDIEGRTGGQAVSVVLINQIANALGVEVREITLPAKQPEKSGQSDEVAA